jgi:chemotaxis protein CheX
MERNVSTYANLISRLTEATTEVFETMVFQTVVPGDPVHGDAPEAGPMIPGAVKVVGTVGFAGSQSGLVSFSTTEAAARSITAAMLGMTPEEVNREVPDAIGEITNMIAGSFRTKMAQDGDAWAISVPTVTVGSDFRMRPLSCRERAVLPFRMGDSDVMVELVLGSS